VIDARRSSSARVNDQGRRREDLCAAHAGPRACSGDRCGRGHERRREVIYRNRRRGDPLETAANDADLTGWTRDGMGVSTTG
jgi:hypothetical protein